MEKFWTPDQFAKVLNVTPRTVINLIHDGKIHAVVVGGKRRTRYRIFPNELDRFMSENFSRHPSEGGIE